MRKILLIAALGTGLAACNSAGSDARQGIAAVHVPVVTSTNYVYDAVAPSGALSPTDTARIDGWFSGLGLDYGDSIYVGSDTPSLARAQVAEIAGRYGLLLDRGAPVAGGMSSPGTVRVIVSRKRASVPGCPDWNQLSNPNFDNKQLPNFGCGVNSNLAMQVADPQDLVHGRQAAAAEDAIAAAKAIEMYRAYTHTALDEGQKKRPLKTTNAKKKDDM